MRDGGGGYVTSLVGPDFIPKRLVAVVAEKGEGLLFDSSVRAGGGHEGRYFADRVLVRL